MVLASWISLLTVLAGVVLLGFHAYARIKAYRLRKWFNSLGTKVRPTRYCSFFHDELAHQYSLLLVIKKEAEDYLFDYRLGYKLIRHDLRAANQAIYTQAVRDLERLRWLSVWSGYVGSIEKDAREHSAAALRPRLRVIPKTKERANG